LCTGPFDGWFEDRSLTWRQRGKGSEVVSQTFLYSCMG
jgi:hypothetical protein